MKRLDEIKHLAGTLKLPVSQVTTLLLQTLDDKIMEGLLSVFTTRTAVAADTLQDLVTWVQHDTENRTVELSNMVTVMPDDVFARAEEQLIANSGADIDERIAALLMVCPPHVDAKAALRMALVHLPAKLEKALLPQVNAQTGRTFTSMVDMCTQLGDNCTTIAGGVVATMSLTGFLYVLVDIAVENGTGGAVTHSYLDALVEVGVSQEKATELMYKLGDKLIKDADIGVEDVEDFVNSITRGDVNKVADIFGALVASEVFPSSDLLVEWTKECDCVKGKEDSKPANPEETKQDIVAKVEEVLLSLKPKHFTAATSLFGAMYSYASGTDAVTLFRTTSLVDALREAVGTKDMSKVFQAYKGLGATAYIKACLQLDVECQGCTKKSLKKLLKTMQEGGL